MSLQRPVYVECPRDSWQGLHQMVPTPVKASYLRALLEAGFTHLDLGSFVSPKHVPQMSDTEAVLAELPEPEGRDYLCIIANPRGLERAADQPKVRSVGYPLSISDTFQRRNTGRSLEDSWEVLAELAEGARAADKRLVVYLSMGFGNPYGDPWSEEVVVDALLRIRDLGIRSVALADTVGQADAQTVRQVCSAVVSRLGAEDLGVHLHARPERARDLVDAALASGIRWFEGALGGVGGCPFAGDELVGNLPTELIADQLDLEVDRVLLDTLAARALELRVRYA